MISELLSDIIDVCHNNAQYLQGTGRRRWMIPTSNTWNQDLLDIEDIKKAFDRTEENRTAISALKGSNRDRDSALLALAYTGMLERSFRIRHQTAARTLAQVAARAEAHEQLHTKVADFIFNLA